jgi:hypothetical protein
MPIFGKSPLERICLNQQVTDFFEPLGFKWYYRYGLLVLQLQGDRDRRLFHPEKSGLGRFGFQLAHFFSTAVFGILNTM